MQFIGRSILLRLALGGLVVGALMVQSAPRAKASRQAVTITQDNLYNATSKAGIKTLAQIIDKDPNDMEARFGLGILQFFAGVEELSQAYYRHGFKVPSDNFFVPFFRFPIEENKNPEPLTYTQLRGYLLAFRNRLVEAENTLAAIDDKPVSLFLALHKIAIDSNKDEAVGDNERLESWIESFFMLGATRRERARIENLPEDQRAAALKALQSLKEMHIAFDTADVYWLRGYVHILMAAIDFGLAHDWEHTFNVSFHLFFANANLPLADDLVGTYVSPNRWDSSKIADFVSLLHTLNWPVVEPERMRGIPTHLLKMIALSRASWQAAVRESDDDNEWLPNAQQTPPFPGFEMTTARIDGWHRILDELEANLEGRTLLPHWRINAPDTKAINVRRVFDEPRTFDFWLWFTGPAAVPYLEDGKERTSRLHWRTLVEPFGNNFPFFVLWIN